MKKTAVKKLHLGKIKIAGLTKASQQRLMGGAFQQAAKVKGTPFTAAGDEGCYSGIIACSLRYCEEQ